MYCLDTSVLIDIFDGKQKIEKKLAKLEGKPIFITPIILCELYKGAAHAGVTRKRLQFIEKLLHVVDFLTFDEAVCKAFGDEYLRLKKKGKIIKDMDLMIAACCKTHNVVLVTSDSKHFSDIKGLALESW